MEKIVLVKFLKKSGLSDSEYAFYTDLDLKEDDIVVCDTKNGYSLAQYVKEAEDASERALANRWIIDTVNMEAQNRRLEMGRIAELEQDGIRERLERIHQFESYKALQQSV